MGVHRLYLRSFWGFAFLPFFLGVLYLNTDIRDAREDVSRTRAAVESAHIVANRARPLPGVEVAPEARERSRQAEAAELAAKAEFEAATREIERYRTISRWLALILLVLVVADGILMPWLVRRGLLPLRTLAERMRGIGPQAPASRLPEAGRLASVP